MVVLMKLHSTFKKDTLQLMQAQKDIKERMARKEIIIGFGHPVYSICDPRNVVIKKLQKNYLKKTIIH